nr:lipoprotein [Neptuniibacter halophilus]
MLFSLVMLAGCGQKGPLYLPDGEEQQNTQQK